MQSQTTTLAKARQYPGAKGKSGHLQHIVSNIPKCDIFIEAMAGSAVISNYLRSYGSYVVSNDYNRSLPVSSHLHYKDLVAKYDYTAAKKVVFYFDPPYMMSTRSWKGKLYKHDWNDRDHVEFLQVVLAVKSDCMISHYPCALYDEMLTSWRQYRYKAMTRAGLRGECIYMNFEQPILLLNSAHVGTNRTKRQQIQRKLSRLLSKIDSLPKSEQAAILTHLTNRFIN